MPAGTKIDALYAAIGNVVNRSTGRSWWDKRGIQAQPSGPYATIFLVSGAGLQLPVTEEILPPGIELFHQIPWGTQILRCQAEFFRSVSGNTAIQAANRFANSLRLQIRWYDLWQLCALSGAVDVIDISAIFRADIEPRARVDFQIAANIIEEPLADTNITDIHQQAFRIDMAEENTTVTVTVTGPPDE